MRETKKYRDHNDLCKATFEEIRDIYKAIMEQNNICAPILVEAAEDETVIEKLIFWDQRTDKLLGFCGPKENYVCSPNFTIVVGDNQDSFGRIQDAFANNVISHMARVIILNPLHIMLPPLVVFLMPTCNRFTHVEVLRQWCQLEEMYEQYLYPTLGPLCSHASDGDSRRRKLMLEKSLTNDGDRYTIAHENFTHSARLQRDKEGNLFPVDLMDQDYIHNGKKLTYPLDHASRVLSIGGHAAHMHHLQLVLDRFQTEEHPIRKEDVHRQDRQNWASAQRLMFPKLRQCLDKIQNGDVGVPEDVAGTIAYLELCWFYVEIFCSFSASLHERIRYASYVCNFLRIWRLWVYRTGTLTLKSNFITRECFQDVTLSCHFAVLLIKATPRHPVLFNKSGSDVCEDYFSQNGSFVMNKHNYSFSDMLQNLSSMNRLQEIRADPEGPHLPKGHKKQENIWHMGNERPENGPDMKYFPTDKEIVHEWEMGLQQAQHKLRDLDVYPADDDFPPDDPDNDWFFRPHHLSSQDDNIMLDQMTTDDSPGDVDDHSEDRDPQQVELFSILRQHGNETETLERHANITKISPTVDVPGIGKMYKSTLVSKLNANPDISKDRLKRVRTTGPITPVPPGENDILVNSSTDICLGSDCGVFIKNRGDIINYQIGRVQRIRNKGGRGFIEYVRPVSLNDSDSMPKVEFHLSMYVSEGENRYVYTSTSQCDFSIYSIIMGVKMHHEGGSNYRLHYNDKIALDTFIEDNKKSGKKSTKSKPKKGLKLADDGRRVTLVKVCMSIKGDNTRKSTRTRKVISYDT